MRHETGSGVGIAAAVVVLLLGLAPVLYVLSLGPAVRLVNSGLLETETAETVYTPLIWVAELCEPAESVISAYVDLWDSPVAVPLNAPLPVSAPLPPPAGP